MTILVDKPLLMQQVFEWADTPKPLRSLRSKAALGRHLKISVMTIDAWLKERDEREHLLEDEDLRVKEVDKIMFQLAKDPKTAAKYKEIFYRRYGKLTDKSETKLKVSLDAGELISIEREARERNISEGYSLGEGEVPGEFTLLSPEIREDSGQA